MKQIRLEALKLAYREDRPAGEIIETAEEFAQYVENGLKVVALEPEQKQSSRRRKPHGKFDL
jgi:hypothetical protein